MNKLIATHNKSPWKKHVIKASRQFLQSAGTVLALVLTENIKNLSTIEVYCLSEKDAFWFAAP